MNDFLSTVPTGAPYPQPMTFGQILDRIYRLMRANLGLFMGIAAVPTTAIYAVFAAAMGCFFLAFWPTVSRTGTVPKFPVYLSVLFVLAVELLPLLVYTLYLPAATYAATQADLGVRVTFRQSYSQAWRRFGRYLWLMVLVALYIYVPIALLAALIGGGALLIEHGARGGPAPEALIALIPLAILLYLAFIVYAVMIFLRFALAFPSSVEENLSAWTALKRSTSLTCGARGRIFLVLLAVYAAAYLVSMVAVAVLFFLGAIGAFAAISAHVTAGSPAFITLIGLAVVLYLFIMVVYASFAYAALNAALAVLYHQQRRRKDGPAAAALPA